MNTLHPSSTFVLAITLASITPNAIASFLGECIGLISLQAVSKVVEYPRKVAPSYINAKFLLHENTFHCTEDVNKPKLTGVQDESLFYTPSTIDKAKLIPGVKLKVRIFGGVPLGPNVDDLNWGIESLVDSIAKKTTMQPVIPNIKVYQGVNFSIEYPKNFKPHPLTPRSRYDVNSARANKVKNVTPKLPLKYYYWVETDEAYFTSPNKEVTFFVYSPLWGGDPKNYLAVAVNEILMDEQTSKGLNTSPYDGKEYDQVLTRRVTVKAKDNSYYRSFIHIRKRSSDFTLGVANIDEVFGIKYKNKEAYDQYRDDYLDFKKSLIKSGD